MDQHFWVAFPASALLIGAIPVILWQQVADQAEFWPRLTAGAVIGTGLVALVSFPVLFRRTRRTALNTLALVIALGLLVAAAMAAYSVRLPLPLADPGQAELVGAAAMITAWGAVAVLGMGRYAVAGPARGRRHCGFIEEFGGGAEYAAACECGWRGQVVQDSSVAFTRAGDHANTVRLTIRKIS
ncbi:hypothetical protein [Nonomuraea sp. NPDC049480]|uniref:hypothetical protein n=1 Tax=Nonomuraea sp. NPDC049480 TaxID=3364353 RepID=UPI0037A8DDB8